MHQGPGEDNPFQERNDGQWKRAETWNCESGKLHGCGKDCSPYASEGTEYLENQPSTASTDTTRINCQPLKTRERVPLDIQAINKEFPDVFTKKEHTIGINVATGALP